MDTFEGWSGRAAEAFRGKFAPHPNQWLTAGDSHTTAASAVSQYADTLSWAQSHAGTAVQQWDQSQQASQTAAAEQAAARGVQQAPFVDPGVAGRESAQATLTSARTQLAHVGGIAAGSVTAAAETAPQESFWPGAGDLVDKPGASPHTSPPRCSPLVASWSPAGAGLIAVSALGEAGGVALDATGIGALVGVPANAVSVAGLSAGVGLMAAGMARGKNTPTRTRTPGLAATAKACATRYGTAERRMRQVTTSIPNTGKKLDPKRWDMGHKDQTLKEHQEDSRGRGLSRKEFLDEHNQPDRYHTEDPSSNRSRRHDK